MIFILDFATSTGLTLESSVNKWLVSRTMAPNCQAGTTRATACHDKCGKLGKQWLKCKSRICFEINTQAI